MPIDKPYYTAPEISPPVSPKKKKELEIPRTAEGDEMNSSRFRNTWNASIQGFKRNVHPKLVRDLNFVMAELGEKIPKLFRHPREAFRPLDLHRTGRICRTEMQNFFLQFNRTDEIADRVFDLLDPDGIGYVDYEVFMTFFDEMDARIPLLRRTTGRAPVLSLEEHKTSNEARQYMNAFAERLVTKYYNAQEAFRALDLNKDGKVNQYELRIWARKMNLGEQFADSFLVALKHHADETGAIPYQSFNKLFRELRGEFEGFSIAFKLPRLS